MTDPLVEYPHTEAWGKSITGGAVYRGSRTPALDGYYLYGDYISGRLWALKYDRETATVTENRPVIWDNLPVFTFGQTDDGEVLMSTMSGGGRIYVSANQRTEAWSDEKYSAIPVKSPCSRHEQS